MKASSLAVLFLSAGIAFAAEDSDGRERKVSCLSGDQVGLEISVGPVGRFGFGIQINCSIHGKSAEIMLNANTDG